MSCECDLCSAKTSKALNSGAMSHMKPLHEKMLDAKQIKSDFYVYWTMSNLFSAKASMTPSFPAQKKIGPPCLSHLCFKTKFQLKVANMIVNVAYMIVNIANMIVSVANMIVSVANMIVNIANMIVNAANMSLKVANMNFGILCSVH